MSRNGSGTYNLPAGNPVVTGTTITTTWANTTLNDIASSLTGSVAADGQTPMTGALNMGSNKITTVTDPTNAQDAATKAYVDAATSGLSATYLTKANNLSDVASTSTSRTNLGLGTIATQAASAVAVTGGAIDGTTIGTTTRSTVKATTLDLGLSTQSVAIGQGNASIMKNRIINGAMVISQRNGTSSVSQTNGSYSLDRWQSVSYTGGATTGKFTVAQSSTAPAGFINSLLVTSSTALSPSSTDIYYVGQIIEGYNIADLGWGTSNGKSITVSFQVQSSLTGTFSAGLRNQNGTYSFPFTYTISSANTWTSVSVTIPAPPVGGTWQTDNSFGLALYINLQLGSANSAAATGAWQAVGVYGASGCVNLLATNGATLNLTGVQLEVGSSATGFEYRQYQQELALCQRYYEKTFPIGTAVAQAAGFAGSLMSIVPQGDTLLYNNWQFASEKRTTPTVTNYNPTQANGVYRSTSNIFDSSALTYVITNGTRTVCWYAGSGQSQNPYAIHATASAEL